MAYFDLGSYGRPVTTASADAQTWFDRGLVWTYGYNHEEAVACFAKAAEADPDCAMAHWGIGYCIGPNYNKPWEFFEEPERRETIARAASTLRAATEAAAGATEAERALIGALAQRYPAETVDEFAPWNDAYADAMRAVYAAHRDDLDIAALFAEAIMNRTPWQLWDLRSGEPAEGADTAEAIAVLERAFAGNPAAWDHPGLLHMYIHLMEMSPFPERALRHGDRLATLVPDAGHLLHMPTHIDVLCGQYENVVRRNTAGIAADRRFVAVRGADNFYSLYRCHNLHFKAYGAMFLGQPTPALEAADALAATIPERFLASLADWFEGFLPIKHHVQIRFGMWREILAEPMPEDTALHCVTAATLRYARAVALANLARPEEAAAEAEAFDAAYAAVPETRMLFNNTCRDILSIAAEMMRGEIAYHAGDRETGFAHLRRAVEIDDGLPYDEPWAWMQPTRHALGALLLDAGRHDEAEAVYRADLGLGGALPRACQHPDNLWSLHGLHECLRTRGETVERPHVKARLDLALARAEVPVHGSCFCRRRAAA